MHIYTHTYIYIIYTYIYIYIYIYIYYRSKLFIPGENSNEEILAYVSTYLRK